MAKIRAKKTEDFKENKKLKKIKQKREISDNEKEVKSFICILIIVLLLATCLYLIANSSNKNSELSTNTNIQYNDISVGMILNRNYDEYYVLVYDFTNSDYNSLVSSYRSLEKQKLYTVDINDKINKDFISDSESNPKAAKVDEFMFNEATLLYIKDNNVVKYITGEKNIKNILK